MLTVPHPAPRLPRPRSPHLPQARLCVWKNTYWASGHRHVGPSPLEPRPPSQATCPPTPGLSLWGHWMVLFWFGAMSVPPNALSGGLSGSVAGTLLLQVCGWDAPDPDPGATRPLPVLNLPCACRAPPSSEQSSISSGDPTGRPPQLSGGPRVAGRVGGSPLMDQVRRAGRDPSACCRSVCLSAP